MKNWILALFASAVPAPQLIDHAPVRHKASKKRQQTKLEKAAARHGKAFKVAAVGLPREVFRGGKMVVVGQPIEQTVSQRIALRKVK